MIRPFCGLFVHAVGDPSILDFKLSSVWDGSSVWTIFVTPGGRFVQPVDLFRPSVLDYIRHLRRASRPLCGLTFACPRGTSNGQPRRVIRPLCLFYGHQMAILVGWSVHLVDFSLHPSILWTYVIILIG